MLTLIVVYFFGIYAFVFFSEDYFTEKINEGESMCYNLWHCFLTTFASGIRLPGGIGDILIWQSFNNKNHYYNRWVFDLLYFLLVYVVLMNLIFGIIIDTFAELRDKKKKVDEDIQDKCFICNLEKHTFERSGCGFYEHYKEDHNVWQYIYYLVHLEQKESTEYSGLEAYVSNMRKKDEYDWFPLHKAMVLGDSSNQEEEEDQSVLIKEKVSCIEQKAAKILNILSKEEREAFN